MRSGPIRSPLVLAVFLIALTTQYYVALAQPVEQRVKVIVSPNHANWTYRKGEPISFDVSVFVNNTLLRNARIGFEFGPEKMEPVRKDSMTLQSGQFTFNGGKADKPGFYRLTVQARFEGKTYRGLATAAVDPLSISPTVAMPADFDSFWQTALAESRAIPMDVKRRLLPERCTENVNVYEVSLQHFRNGTRLYGILAVPKKEGKYPALLRVPGAGVRAYGGDVATAEKGIITLEIGIHGISVTMDPSVYTDLAAGPLQGYFNYNADHRDRFYYKRVYLGCVRANDFLWTLPEFDGANLGVTGGSQGGALSIVTAALDKRVRYLAAYYPALSDVTGYLNGRAGGWPHYFEKQNLAFNDTEAKKRTLPYYDVVNFARKVTVPGMYSWGFNDETCPPTSMYAAYNVIQAPKGLELYPETGHWTFPEQREKLTAWMISKLKPAAVNGQ